MAGRRKDAARRVLVIDIGGTNVKILATGESEPRRFPSGKTLTPRRMVAGVKKLAGDWKYDVVAIGYPGPVLKGGPAAEPHNLARGWVGFDFRKAFGRPVKIVNDAAMQALGGYKGGTMLFLGLGTGLGSTLIANGTVVPMELAHLPYQKGDVRGLHRASAAWRSTARRDGGRASRTSWSGSRRPSSWTTSSSAEGTRRS